MKKKLMRMIAGILFVCMMLGNMSVAYGAETDAKDIQTAAEGSMKRRIHFQPVRHNAIAWPQNPIKP